MTSFWGILGILVSVVCFLIIIVYTVYFYTSRNEIFYQKRNGHFTLVQSAIMIVFLIVDLISYLVFFFEKITDPHGIIFIANWVVFYAIESVLLVRYVLLYFHINWHKSFDNLKWKRYINEDSLKNDFDTKFMRRMKIFGNKKNLLMIVISVWLIWSTLEVLIEIFEWRQIFAGVLKASLTIIVSIIIIYCWFKTPKLFPQDDELFVYGEMKHIGIAQIVMTLISGVLAGIFRGLKWVVVEKVCLHIVTNLNALIFTLISSYGVLKKNKYSYYLDTSDKTQTADVTSDELKTFLTNQECYESLMNYAQKELCSESMLAFTEFIQWRNYVKSLDKDKVNNKVIGNDDNINSDTKITVKEERTETIKHASASPKNEQIFGKIQNHRKQYLETFLNQIHLPEGIPQSYIVFNKDGNDNNGYITLKLKAYDLYEKYINSNNQSPLTINISYQTRNRLDKLMEVKHAWLVNKDYNDQHKLATLFDDSAHGVFKLIANIFARFVCKENYKIH